MTLRPSTYSVPEQTEQIAKAVFPDGNPYLTLREHLGNIFADQDFSALFPNNGQPAFSPMRLMLVFILQYADRLSDHQGRKQSGQGSIGNSCYAWS